MGECLSRTIEIYRRDALQSDGKSDGESVASSRREKFTVRRIPKLTVNSGRKVQHPCGFPGDRRIGPADGKSACSQATARTVRGVSWRRAAQGNGRAGDETMLFVDLFELHHQRQPLRDRRSTRGSRQRPTLATSHSRVGSIPADESRRVTRSSRKEENDGDASPPAPRTVVEVADVVARPADELDGLAAELHHLADEYGDGN